MILENLKDFEWYNEPENVIFDGKEMKIIAARKTDFWQSLHHNFSKDNGHFFFKRLDGDFSCVVKWHFDNAENFKQCGLMVRVDERNWFKMSMMYQSLYQPEIGSCVTNCGYSDWASTPLAPGIDAIWYKLVRKDNDFAAFYSLDGENFIRLRQFYLLNVQPIVRSGAYLCSPQDETFEAVLEDAAFS